MALCFYRNKINQIVRIRIRDLSQITKFLHNLEVKKPIVQRSSLNSLRCCLRKRWATVSPTTGTITLMGLSSFFKTKRDPEPRTQSADSESHSERKAFEMIVLPPPHEGQSSDKPTTATTSFQPNDPRLRSKECLKNAAGLAVDSSSAVLSQTVFAIIKIEEEYVQLVDVLIKLLEIQLQILGHKAEEEKMFDLIMETRHEIDKVYQRKQDLNILFASAEKLSEATAEIAFITGSDYASTAVGERLHSAQSEVRKVQAISQEAEERLRKAQVHSIEATAAHNSEQERLKAATNVDHDLDLEESDEHSNTIQEGQKPAADVDDEFDVDDKTQNFIQEEKL